MVHRSESSTGSINGAMPGTSDEMRVERTMACTSARSYASITWSGQCQAMGLRLRSAAPHTNQEAAGTDTKFYAGSLGGRDCGDGPRDRLLRHQWIVPGRPTGNERKGNEVTRVPSPSHGTSIKRPTGLAAALLEELPDDPVARKALRDRIVEEIKQHLSDPGNAGVPHDEFVRNRPPLA